MLSVGANIWTPTRVGSSLTAQVQALFAGRAGGMWDMGDIATLFQDSPGDPSFSPVTSAGQQIGTTLDKSKKSAWTDNTGSTWVKTAGDGVVTVVGNTVTITGATTTTTVDRVGGTIPFVPGIAVMNYSVSWVTAGTIRVYVRGINLGAPVNGVTTELPTSLNLSAVDRLYLDSGTATFTINSFKYWEGNHATQSTAGSRSLYQVVGGYGCAQFDGVNDLLQVSGINLSATNKVLIGLAFKPNTTALSVAMEYSATAVSSPGAFYVSLNESGTGKHNMLANNGGGGGLDVVKLSSAVALAPTVLIDYIDLAQLAAIAKHSVRVNGASAGITSVIDGPDVAGNFGNYNLFLGARSGSSLPSNMNLYRAFVLAGSSTAGEQLILENWLRESCGV